FATTASTPPSASAAANASATVSVRVASPEIAVTPARAESSDRSPTSTVTTRAPSARKRSTVARPIPAAPPVTSATRPARAPRSVVEAVVRPSQQLGAAGSHDRGVLVADPARELGAIDAGLGDDDHVLAELVRAPGHQLRPRLV